MGKVQEVYNNFKDTFNFGKDIGKNILSNPKKAIDNPIAAVLPPAKKPTTETVTIESTSGIGAVSGGSINTFDEEEKRKKKLMTKKKGATALRIPLQNLEAPKTALGLNTDNSTGIQI